MAKKKRVLLYIDNEIVQTAKDLGLNLSKVSENALKEAIRRLKGINSENNCPGGINCGENSGKWTEGDLNPRPPECKSGVHTS